VESLPDTERDLRVAPQRPVSSDTPIVRIDIHRTSLLPHFCELWSHRELIYFFVWRDIKVRYKQSVIGVGWAIIQPFTIMVVFSLLFGRLARLPSDGVPYPIFYYSALLPWLYFANSLTQVTNSVVGHQGLIQKVYFPRLILPIVAIVSGLADLGMAFIVLAGMALFYGMVPGWSVLLLPAYVLLTILTALSLGLWLAALNAVYRDVRHAVPFVTQIWMFASPVVYSSTLVPESWRWLYRLNPLAGAIEGFRWALTGKGTPFDFSMLASVVIVVLVGITGLFYFRKTESTIVDVV
jgi:lipopolysaccharide transport system permease protein